MQLYRFDASAGKEITLFGSTGLVQTFIARPQGDVRISLFTLGEGGLVALHPAGMSQLLLVTQGEGWVCGEDGARVSIRAGQAALWQAGEDHATGTAGGLTAVVLEAQQMGLLLAG